LKYKHKSITDFLHKSSNVEELVDC
jgi:hypothetical protein